LSRRRSAYGRIYSPLTHHTIQVSSDDLQIIEAYHVGVVLSETLDWISQVAQSQLREIRCQPYDPPFTPKACKPCDFLKPSCRPNFQTEEMEHPSHKHQRERAFDETTSKAAQAVLARVQIPPAHPKVFLRQNSPRPREPSGETICSRTLSPEYGSVRTKNVTESRQDT